MNERSSVWGARPGVPEPSRAGEDGAPSRRVHAGESEERLRLAVEAAGLGTFARDASTGRFTGSAAFLSLLGLPPATALPADEDTLLATLPRADREACRAAFARAFDPTGDGAFEVEVRAARGDGGERWLRLRGRASFSGAGPQRRALCVNGIADDVTERRAKDEQLDLLKRSLDHAPHAAYWFDPEGRFVYLNESGARILGYTREELMALGVHDVNPRATPARWAEVFALLKSRGPMTLASEHRRKDGTTFPVELTSAYFKHDEREYCLGFAIDITARQRAEREKEALQEQLAQARKMESVGRLAGGVAHDFNNMLGVIMGRADLALARLGPGSELRPDLEEIAVAARRSAELTRQLLAFARRQPVAPRVLDLNVTVEGMLKVLRRVLGETVQLDWRPAGGLWTVRVDPSQVHQILLNLVVNARDAMACGGTVSLATANVPAAAGHEGDRVRLTVRDEGGGMAPEVLSHLFEPFFTTKEPGRGTGLGLATVHGIVHQNGGAIEVDSAPGAGATFRIDLPRHQEPASVEEPLARARGAGERVLLVEDEPALLATSRQMLESLGYEVLAAGSPAEALRIADARSGIDLLVVDVVMAEMDGRALALRLQAAHPGLPALFVSGYTADIIAKQGALEAGLHFLEKPFTAEALGAKVRQALAG